MARSVLRLADQRRDVFPDRCVLSGVQTTGAIRTTAVVWRGRRWMLFVPAFVAVLARVLRRPHVDVSIPVDADVWSRWRRRVVLSQGAVAFGGVFVATGLVVGAAAPFAFGVVVFTGAFALWARANRNWWITCVLDPAGAVVVVEPTHREFDRSAREIFVRSIR
jgi:hypothetical protein